LKISLNLVLRKFMEEGVSCKFDLRWVLALGSLGSINNFVVANEFGSLGTS
jgi:hypothetical protein